MSVRICGLFAAIALACGIPASAQRAAEPPVNAALRYWMAFAQMQDPAADDGTAQLLARVEAGEAAWDEERLGPIVRANSSALATMHRAAALAACDWGLEVDFGPATPIAHLARARALARLNTLAGVRLTALGRSDEAVDAWIAGIRFSQHVAQGGSLIAVLSGRAALRSSLRALTLAAEKGQLNGGQRARVAAAVAGIPETGFAWDDAIRAEQRALDVWVARLSRVPDFARAYEETAGSPPPAGLSLPSDTAVRQFQTTMASVARAFALTPDRTRTALASLEGAIDAMHPFYQIPLLSRVNDTRAELKGERDRLLAALGQ